MPVSYTQEEFNEKAIEILNLSEKFNDTWKLNRKDSIIYLTRNDKFSIKTESDNKSRIIEEDVSALAIFEDLVTCEYHVLLHPTYQVPAVFFNAYRDGKLIDFNDLERFFCEEYDTSQYEIHQIISQAEHPFLFRPFFVIHPCKIGEVLEKFPLSKNFIITFLTIFGPSIRLKMSAEYEKYFR